VCNPIKKEKRMKSELIIIGVAALGCLCIVGIYGEAFLY